MKKIISLLSLFLIISITSCMTAKDSNDGAMKEAAIYEGYLIDVWCGEPGKGMDGSDVVNDPAGHSTKCLIMCEEGGYGISVKEGDVYKFIPFSNEESNKKAIALISETDREKDNKVSIKGYMMDGKLNVISIKEIN